MTHFNQHGGLLIETENREEAFFTFLEHSRIHILSRGSFGLTFVASLPENKRNYSSYKHTDAALYGKPVTTLLFKLMFVYDKQVKQQASVFSYTFKNKTKTMREISTDTFNQEVNNQIEIYFSSLKYLQPYCPGIVYANMIEPEEVLLHKNGGNSETSLNAEKILMTIFKNLENVEYSQKNTEKDTDMSTTHETSTSYNDTETSYDEAGDIIQGMINKIEKEEGQSNIGIIAMQYFDQENYSLLKNESVQIKSMEESNEKDAKYEDGYEEKFEVSTIYYLACYYLIVKIAVNTGYSHGDFHRSNILINTGDKQYFHNTRIDNILIGRPILIDFGLSFKLSEKEHNTIKEAYAKGDYSSILKYLCALGGGINGKHSLERSIYDWTCRQDEMYILFDKSFELLDIARTQAEIDLVTQFDELHKKDENIPLLPLYKTSWKTNPLLKKMFVPANFNIQIEESLDNSGKEIKEDKEEKEIKEDNIFVTDEEKTSVESNNPESVNSSKDKEDNANVSSVSTESKEDNANVSSVSTESKEDKKEGDEIKGGKSRKRRMSKQARNTIKSRK
jgi:hypothetical protein